MLIVCCSSVGLSQNPDSVAVERTVDSLVAVWNTLGKASQFEQIVEGTRQAARMVEENIGKYNAAYSRITLTAARAHEGLAQYPDAEARYRETIAIRERVYGRQSGECATAINSLGRLYLNIGEYVQAEPLFKEALEAAEKRYGRVSDQAIASVNNLGILNYYSGKYDIARPYFEEVKAYREKRFGKESEQYASALENLANLNTDLADYTAAEPLYQEALSIIEKIHGRNSSNYAFTLGNLSTLYTATGDLVKAEAACREVLAIREQFPGRETPEYTSALHNLAGVFLGSSQFEAAIVLLEQIAAFQAKIYGKKNIQYAGALNDLAIACHRLGMYEKAESCYQESCDIRKAELGTDNLEYAWSLNNLAIFYLDIGNLDKAERLHTEALAIRKKALEPTHPVYAASLNNLAAVYSKQGRLDEAIALYKAALAIQQNDRPEYAGALINLANMHIAKRNFNEAVTQFLEAKAILEKNPALKKHPYYLACLESLGDVYYETGQLELAETHFQEAQRQREELLGPAHPSSVAGHVRLANLFWKQNDFNRSGQQFLLAGQKNREALLRAARHLSEAEMAGYVKSFEFFLHQTRSFTMQTPDASAVGECWDNTLFHKGFLLAAASRIRTSPDIADPKTAEKFALFRSCLRRLEKEYAKPLAEQKNVPELKEQANTLEKDLVRVVADLDEATRNVGWQDVQSALSPGEAAIEVIHFQFRNPARTDSVLYAALILKPGMPQPVYIPLFEEKQLRALLPNSAAELNLDQVNELYAPAAGSNENALYHLVWSPLESHLKDVRTVYFSPSGLLHRLNLSALPTAAQTTLADQYDLVLLGSTRQLAYQARHITATEPSSALLYGGIQFSMDSTAYPARATSSADNRGGPAFDQTDAALRGEEYWDFLNGSDKEVDRIQAVLSKAGVPVQAVKGWKATEESFKQIGQADPSPKILHISTHGFFFPDPDLAAGDGQVEQLGEHVVRLSDHPMIRSGLVLAGANHAWKTGRPLGNREDGILTAYEISQLDLRHTDLVVLSACKTGLGHIEANEGVYGLQRAFKIAGARTLVMSLWKAPDHATQEMMAVFYQKLLGENLPARQALRAAQNEMRRQRYEPYHWAGFVVVE